MTLNQLAHDYVRLVKCLGRHSDLYIDAMYGPSVTVDAGEGLPLEAISEQAEALEQKLAQLGEPAPEEISEYSHSYVTPEALYHLRRIYLLKQAQALKTFAASLHRPKERPKFDEEAIKLYDAVPPRHTKEHYDEILRRLDGSLPQYPDAPSLAERYARYQQEFVIPPDRLDLVFQAAISEARRRTKLWITLPPTESFSVSYVSGKPWAAYNWYKGNYHSVIEVNTELPIHIDRAFDLAAHEGYPGHHVYNTLLEAELVNKNRFIEFSIYPLFSPQSLIAEGSANYGIYMCFPTLDDRIEFESNHLFPLAGLDPSKARRYYEIESQLHELSYAGNEAARLYLDGQLSYEETVQWLCDYALMPRDRAVRRIKFIEVYRSYVINYNLGQDMVKEHISAACIVDNDQGQRWKEFQVLLSTPQVPSQLKTSLGAMK